jgi:hypothetical protein
MYLWLRRLKWGVSEFEMAAVPGVIGGPMAGVIHAPGGIDPQDGFLLRLVCVRPAKGEDQPEKTLWEREQRLLRDLITADGRRTLIPVKFTIPYELPASADDVKWKLQSSAAVRGIDYFAEFELPVFKTAASSPTQATTHDNDADDHSPRVKLDAELPPELNGE